MGLVVLHLVAGRVGHRIAAWCAIAAVSGGVVVEKLRLAEFDGLLTAGVGVAIAAACSNLAAKRPKLGLWILAYFALTAAFLAKGAPALMHFGPGLLAAGWATRRFRRLLDWRHILAAAVFLALSGGYLAAVYRTAGPVAFVQPIEESWIRGFAWSRPAKDASARAIELRMSPDEEAISRRPGAVVARTAAKPLLILAALLPWSLLAPFALSIRGHRTGSEARELLMLAAGAFAVLAVLVFMAVPTHSTRYYMPMCVSFGILAGIVATHSPESGPKARIAPWITSLGITLLAGGVSMAGAILLEDPVVSIGSRIGFFALGALTIGLAVHSIRSRGRETTAILLLLAATCVFAVERLGRQKVKEAKRTLRPQAEALARHLPANEPVWILGPSDIAGKNSSLFFYLERPVVAFRPGDGSLPPGAYCLLTSDRMDELDDPPGFEFREITRAEHVWRDYLLGRCSWPG